MISGDDYYHNFVLSIGRQTIVDKNVYTEQFTESRTNNANFNYSLRNNLINYGLEAGLNYLQLNSEQQSIARYGLSLGGDKDFFDKKLNIRLNGMYNFSQKDGNRDGNVINGSLDIRYRPNEAHNFSLRTQAIINQTSNAYQDYVISANYSFTL